MRAKKVLVTLDRLDSDMYVSKMIEISKHWQKNN